MPNKLLNPFTPDFVPRHLPKTNPISNNNSLFPPGYIPPHLMKPKAPDGLASNEALKADAAQTKKEKLKMSR